MKAPEIETLEQAVDLAIAIQQSVKHQEEWGDRNTCYLFIMDRPAFHAMLIRYWNDIWSDEQARQILSRYTALRLAR